ncbi:WGR domain-containing protein [Marinobacter hydrocarbonoclasticus]|uniref:WGR domain-containing protein n=1 Tax=Marinobacter nauticus TaxID=2743 RepID=UPI001C93F653|nr:WGR domain-containing protein [Marinobacter nauticus]MBY6216710.1 WGR domain-containing protein [Marinobacter nauticus]
MSALLWETQNRFYRVTVQKDLFGGLAVLCVWGSKTSRHGRSKLIPCSDLSEVRSTVRKISRIRRQHRYEFCPQRCGKAQG